VTRSVLVTGAAGYLGGRLVASLAADPGPSLRRIVAVDVRPLPAIPGIVGVVADVRDPALADLCAVHRVEVVVHLAAVVTPEGRPDRARAWSIDVGGTRNVLEACVAAGVRKVIVSSSGAAYGYHADAPAWLEEDHPLRGNPEFAYADHKRQVEEMLAAWRRDHPELTQLVFRPGTILGRETRNQITALFDRPFVVGVAGAETPFVLVWDEDVVACLRRGIFTDAAGVYNLAGDGTLTLREMARRMGKPYLPVPAPLLRGVLAALGRVGLTRHGPEQVDFLRYRPVLANRRLKEEFGYVPAKTTSEVFDVFLEGRRGAP